MTQESPAKVMFMINGLLFAIGGALHSCLLTPVLGLLGPMMVANDPEAPGVGFWLVAGFVVFGTGVVMFGIAALQRSASLATEGPSATPVVAGLVGGGFALLNLLWCLLTCDCLRTMGFGLLALWSGVCVVVHLANAR